MKTSDIDAEIKQRNKIVWLSLILLLVSYGLVGWDLAAHHVIWFMGLVIIALAMTLSWAGSSLIKQLLDYIPKILLVPLVFSILATLGFTSSLFLILALVPFLTTFLAWNEVQFASQSKTLTFWIVVLTAVLGLGGGEFLDLWIYPSARH